MISSAEVNDLEWRRDPNSEEWDSALAKLRGHPLQSAFWGNARRAVDGIQDHRWLATKQGSPIWMIRLEERPVPLLGCIAWAPKGPVGELPPSAEFPPAKLIDRLRERRTRLLITNPWKRVEESSRTNGSAFPRTIWIDVGAGREAVWNRLDPQFRQGLRRATRLGVIVERTQSGSDVEGFFALCTNISYAKGFRLPASLELMRCLLLSDGSASMEACLFIARYQGKLGAGAFIIRCGSSIHYFWGGTDRALSSQRLGEAVHWAAIEWALANNCVRYDLEGIDAEGNPGTYTFKKKMGGSEVVLAGKTHYSLDIHGRLLSWLEARLN